MLDVTDYLVDIIQRANGPPANDHIYVLRCITSRLDTTAAMALSSLVRPSIVALSAAAALNAYGDAVTFVEGEYSSLSHSEDFQEFIMDYC